RNPHLILYLLRPRNPTDRHAIFYEYHGSRSDTKVPVEHDLIESAVDLERSRLGNTSASDLHRIPRIEFRWCLLREPRQHQSCLINNSSAERRPKPVVTGDRNLTHLL